MSNLYDVSLTITYEAESLDDADLFLQEILDDLYDKNIDISGEATIEESVIVDD